MKCMQRIRITHSLYVCISADGTHTLYVQYLCESQLVLRTHLAEGACALGSSGVARQCGEWREGGKTRRSQRVATGTRPTVFKWKTVRNQSPPMDKMKPHGKQGTAALIPSTCTHAPCTAATLHTHTLTQHPPDINKL